MTSASSMYTLSMAAPILPGILQTVAPILNNYGYLAVGFFLLLENFGLPLPGETILIAASVYAGAGQLNIFALAIIAIAASIIGDNIGFAIGRFGGERIILKYGKYILLSERRLKAAQTFFDKFGGPVVLIARFIAGLRQLNGIVAGTAEMKWRTFVIFNSIGATLWVGVWSSVGYFAGANIGQIYNYLHHAELVAGAIVFILIVISVLKILKNRGR